jgi:hypothetical protein
MDVSYARIVIRLKLIPPSSKQVLDGSKVFFANFEMFTKLISD